MQDFGSLALPLPTDIVFGEGTSRTIGTHARAHGTKALLIAGASSGETSGAFDRILPSLKSAGVEATIYNGVMPNPVCAVLFEGADIARSFGADLIIGVGGGSPLDAAKGVAILATNDGPPERYFTEAPAQEPLPILAVPTTAGTGSEVTPYAIIIDNSSGTAIKKSIRHSSLFPRTAIVDPELTYTMPPSITADTGMDVLSHALEGILCSRRGPVTTHVAMESIRLVLQHIRQAFDSPNNVDARAGMSMASLLAGVVIAQTRTELIHAMGYTLTVDFGIPHGRANAMLIPSVIRLYSPSDVLGWVCKSLGGKWVTDKRTGEYIAREIEELIRDIEIEPNLDSPVSDEQLAAFAQTVIANEQKMESCHRRPTHNEITTIFGRVLR